MHSLDAPRFTVRRADWDADQAALRRVREAVFVREQRVPEALEWDGLDADAVHVLAQAEDGAAIGTARMLASGRIGRIAVLPDRRRQQVGTRLLIELLRIASAAPGPAPFLHAQTAAIPFYSALGFATEGEVFEEAGIAHRRMVLRDLERPLLADLQTRVLGHTAGVLRIDQPRLLQRAVAAMTSQARRELRLLTLDLEPTLYDQRSFLNQVTRLAVECRGRLPVRILLIDAEPALRHGHRMIELSRKLSSAVQVRGVPDELADQCDHYLLADDVGYCLRRHAAPNPVLVDYQDARAVRQMRLGFDRIWEQGVVHPGLRRLHL